MGHHRQIFLFHCIDQLFVDQRPQIHVAISIEDINRGIYASNVLDCGKIEAVLDECKQAALATGNIDGITKPF